MQRHSLCTHHFRLQVYLLVSATEDAKELTTKILQQLLKQDADLAYTVLAALISYFQDMYRFKHLHIAPIESLYKTLPDDQQEDLIKILLIQEKIRLLQEEEKQKTPEQERYKDNPIYEELAKGRGDANRTTVSLMLALLKAVIKSNHSQSKMHQHFHLLFQNSAPKDALALWGQHWKNLEKHYDPEDLEELQPLLDALIYMAEAISNVMFCHVVINTEHDRHSGVPVVLTTGK